jgi:hypothetical protein
MPLPASPRNAILSQLNAMFDAMEAGTLFTNLEWAHQSFEFTASGRRFIVRAVPAGSDDYAIINLTIKRAP